MMKTWVINTTHVELDGKLVVGITTEEWIRASGDEDRPGDATTFMWVVLARDQLLEIGFRPHSHVTEQECLAQLRVLLAMIRPFAAGEDHEKFFMRRLPQRGVR